MADAGKHQFNRALPAWEEVQAHFERQLGIQRWHDLSQLANQVTTIATKQGDLS
jgi:hypothetical protein